MEPFTLDKWIKLFPLSAEERRYVCGRSIIGPGSLALVEQCRAAIQQRPNLGIFSEGSVRQKTNLGRTKPVDVFVLAKGEPPVRDATKIGGVPYRPRAKPWPLTPDGKPATFLAQFNFMQSRDILSSLPGDILLMFS